MESNEGLFKNKIVDPSLLFVSEFWDDIDGFYDNVYYPKSILELDDSLIEEYYGAYKKNEELISREQIGFLCERHFKGFSWEENRDILDTIREAFPSFYMTSVIPLPIQHIMLEELMFLFKKSTIVSRLKRSLKFFEKFNGIPLINLEKRTPEEWKDTVSGIKKAFGLVNYVASVGGFTLALGFPVGTFVGIMGGKVVDGVRMIIIDP